MFGSYGSFMEAFAMVSLYAVVICCFTIVAVMLIALFVRLTICAFGNLFFAKTSLKVLGFIQIVCLFMFGYFAIDLINHQFFTEFAATTWREQMDVSHEKITYLMYFLVNVSFICGIYWGCQLVVILMEDDK